MELTHEKERAAILEDRVQQLRRHGGEGDALSGEAPPEAVAELQLQEVDEHMVRLKADLVVRAFILL